MITSLGSVTFSCNLPSILSIDHYDCEVLTFCVYIDRSLIYSTSLQCCNGTAKFYDLDQIVSQYMLDHRLASAELEVSAKYEGGEVAETATVIFSNLRTNYSSDTSFLRDNYLTTRTFFRIPRNATQWVSYFADHSENAHKGIVTAALRFDDDSVRTVTLSHNLSSSSSPTGVFTFAVSHSILKTQVATLYSKSDFSVLEATFKHGNRFLTFFFTDEQPAEVMTFFNAFNVLETAYIFGSRTVVTDLSKKEAVIQRRTSFYNQASDQRFKIETANLTVEEALWCNQLLTSHYVCSLTPNPFRDQEILIDDVTSEIDLNMGDPIHLKFSYRYATPEPHQVIHSANNVFDPSYAVQFGVAVPP